MAARGRSSSRRAASGTICGFQVVAAPVASASTSWPRKGRFLGRDGAAQQPRGERSPRAVPSPKGWPSSLRCGRCRMINACAAPNRSRALRVASRSARTTLIATGRSSRSSCAAYGPHAALSQQARHPAAERSMVSRVRYPASRLVKSPDAHRVRVWLSGVRASSPSRRATGGRRPEHRRS